MWLTLQNTNLGKKHLKFLNNHNNLIENNTTMYKYKTMLKLIYKIVVVPALGTVWTMEALFIT